MTATKKKPTAKATITKDTKKAPAKTKPSKAKPAVKPAPETTPPDIIDAGGGILVEIAPPPKLIEGSLSAALREAGDVHGISDPPEKPSKKKTKPATESPKKLSALDAAAKVLADAGEPMNAKQMIESMTTQGLWKSPGGKTPHATLYSAILREIGTKGAEARFTKTSKGHFAAKA